MPLPPFLISATVFVCERALIEKDEVLSAIRLVDVFYVAEPPSDEPEETACPVITAWAVASLRAKPGYSQIHTIELKFMNASGTLTAIGDPGIQAFGSKVEGAPGAISIAAQLHLGIKRLGTCYVSVWVDGEEIAKTPITLTLKPIAHRTE